MDHREQIINEISRDMCFFAEDCLSKNSCTALNCEKTWLAEKLYNAGYRKLPEDSVVLSEGEYSDILNDEIQIIERDIAEFWAYGKFDEVVKELYNLGYRKLDDHAIMVLRKAKGIENRIRKETAEKIFNSLLKEFNKRKSCGNADVVVYELAKQFGVEIKE